jgi:hypothetical protein
VTAHGRLGRVSVRRLASELLVRRRGDALVAVRGPTGRPQQRPDRLGACVQSACFRKNAGISISSIPLLASASTFAAACVRPVRQTLGVASWL